MPSLNITNIPAPRVPFIDERTGLMSREWYRFFQNLFILTGSGSNATTLEDLQLGPTNQFDMLVNQANNLQPVVQIGTIANYNLNGSPTAGGVAYGTGPALAVSAAGTSGQVLTSAGAGTPTWTSVSGTGTVTSMSVVSANGLAGTVATATSTPAITLSTTIIGVLKGDGTAISAATSGTDYAPATSGTSILYGNGGGGFSNVTIGAGVNFSGGTLSVTGTVTSVTGTAPVVSSGGATPAISMAAATSSVNGYLTSTDWTTFNSKGSGTVTSVTGTAGRITSTGGTTPVIDLASGVASAGTTGSASLIPVITIDTYGRVTTLTTAANPQGTVTSVAALTLGTTGTDLSSTVANGTTTPVITLQVPTASAANRGALSAADWTTFNNKGTVTSVAQSFTGGLISVAGSPIATSGTLALTVAGTSGGVPYFSTASTWATSAALAANALVLGGGAGAAPATTTTGTGVVTALGVNTGSAGAVVVNGGALGTPSGGTVTNLTGTASININGTVGATTPTTAVFTKSTYSAGTTTIAPINLTSGTNLTTSVAGASEYDGTNLYFTQNTTQGRGVVPICQQFYLAAAGSAIATGIASFFGVNSSISLNASSTYVIEAFCYFLKTTAGTATWTHTISSAATVAHAILEMTPITGFTTTIITGAMITTEATQETSTALVHTVTGSLTTAVRHITKFTVQITTNLACNYRLQITQSAGTVTPQAGSWYKVTRVGLSAGNFVA